MKKLLYLFLTVLIVACSGEDGSNAMTQMTETTHSLFVMETIPFI